MSPILLITVCIAYLGHGHRLPYTSRNQRELALEARLCGPRSCEGFASSSSPLRRLLLAHHPVSRARLATRSLVAKHRTSREIAMQDASVDQMDEAALLLNPSSFKPTRGPDGRLEPVLTLPGDNIKTTVVMKLLTLVSTLEMLAIVTRGFACSDNPLWPVLAIALGILSGEMFSGTFHWATDNYGSIKTPVVGFACAAFQGHHLAPWTISHRSFFNNVHKIAAAAIPLMFVGGLLLPPSGAVFLAVLLYSQLLAQEFHRWTHTPPKLLPRWRRELQNAGIALPLSEHLAHHRPPFDKHYCILTGQLNPILDAEPLLFWRRLEAFVYHLNGQEPLSWKSEDVKTLALETWSRDRVLRPLLTMVMTALGKRVASHVE